MYTLQIPCIAAFILTMPTLGAVDVTMFSDGEQWREAIGHNYTTIDFTGGENGAFILNDYAHLGVTFSDNARYWNTNAFPNDDWGMEAVGGAFVTFDTPQQWIAVDHPGLIWFRLFSEGEEIYTSPVMGWWSGHFSGLISSQQFDMVYLFKEEPGSVNIPAIDDLYFGAVPAPGALGLLLLAGLTTRRRRRKGGY
jgi:MYXO-CTERM domain-containing protein